MPDSRSCKARSCRTRVGVVRCIWNRQDYIARLLAAEVASQWDIEEVNAGALTTTALRAMERVLSLRGMGQRGGRALIVNEAHGLRRDVIRALLVMLERLPPHVAVIFTTTTEGQQSLFEDYDDASPLLSRCLRLDLSRRDLGRPLAERCKQIAEREGLDGKPPERYVKLLLEQRLKSASSNLPY